MFSNEPPHRWQINWLRPRLAWNKATVRPAEIGDGLCRVMTTRKNILEDANYNKIAPNHFVVEINPTSYAQIFEPIANNLIQQWRDRLVECLNIANSRLGRREYRLVGPVRVELRSTPDMVDHQVRILCRVEAEIGGAEGIVPRVTQDSDKEYAYLELLNGHQRWLLYPGDNTVGRDESCDIYLDLPQVQERRLVSAQHAIIRLVEGHSLLTDGSPSGKPSANGTFVNMQRIQSSGVLLKDGDTIILAATDPVNPRIDTPGVAAFRFRKLRLSSNQPLERFV